jgi:hypothetical protein
MCTDTAWDYCLIIFISCSSPHDQATSLKASLSSPPHESRMHNAPRPIRQRSQARRLNLHLRTVCSKLNGLMATTRLNSVPQLEGFIPADWGKSSAGWTWTESHTNNWALMTAQYLQTHMATVVRYHRHCGTSKGFEVLKDYVMCILKSLTPSIQILTINTAVLRISYYDGPFKKQKTRCYKCFSNLSHVSFY